MPVDEVVGRCCPKRRRSHQIGRFMWIFEFPVSCLSVLFGFLHLLEWLVELGPVLKIVIAFILLHLTRFFASILHSIIHVHYTFTLHLHLHSHHLHRLSFNTSHHRHWRYDSGPWHSFGFFSQFCSDNSIELLFELLESDAVGFVETLH